MLQRPVRGDIIEYLGSAGNYPTTTLSEAGVDRERVDELIARARREVDGGPLRSCQLALARDGKLVTYMTLGAAEPDSRYVIFSCSKAVIAAAVWMLIGDGCVRSDQRAAEIIPEFGTNGKDVVTIENLLTHTGGFPHAPMGPPDWYSRADRLAQFGRWRLNWEPSSRYEYHSTAAHWVLAEIIFRVSGIDHREFIAERISKPLGLRLRMGAGESERGDVNELVSFGEPPTSEQLAQLGISDWDPGEVVNENLIKLNEPANMAVGVPGGGGVATAADLALFYQALMHNDRALWKPDVLEAGTAQIVCDFEEAVTHAPAHRTLGLALAGDDGKAALRGFGHTVSGRAFGHGGAGGQIGWADPESGLSFGYLTNSIDAYVINQWRRIVGLSSRAGACTTI